MAWIIARSLPHASLLEPYRALGAYTDCLTLDVDGRVTLEQLVFAFYTSAAFRPERLLLGWLLRMPASNENAAALAAGQINRFSAWTTEARSADQILLCDYQGRTRSWLMVMPLDGAKSKTQLVTRLHFGTAVTTPDKSRTRRWLAVLIFRGLLWFHKAYARALLHGAARRLTRRINLR